MTTSVLRLVSSCALLLVAPFIAQAQVNHDQASPANLIQIVRAATEQYLDVNNAGPDYAPAFGCVSGPDHGAMGIHYINGKLVGDGEIDALRLGAVA